MADNKKSSISKRSSCYLLNLKQPDKTARRLKLSFQRTAASVVILKAERVVEASVGFLDISETGAGVFTPELLHKGSMVELCITEPSILKVRGVVAWSIPVTSGIHGGKFNCRSGIQFVFDGDTQQAAVQEFVKKAGTDPIEGLKLATAQARLALAGNNTDATLTPATPAVDTSAITPASDAPAVTPAADEIAGPSVAAVAPVEGTAAPTVEAAAPVAEVAPVPAVEAVAEVTAAPEGGQSDGGQQAA